MRIYGNKITVKNERISQLRNPFLYPLNHLVQTTRLTNNYCLASQLTSPQLICNDLLSSTCYRKSPQFCVKLYLKTPRKSFGISVSGIGHSDIRGLVTYRSMVRREPHYLFSWIANETYCHICPDTVTSWMTRTLKWPITSSRYLQVCNCCFPLAEYSLSVSRF